MSNNFTYRNSLLGTVLNTSDDQIVMSGVSQSSGPDACIYNSGQFVISNGSFETKGDAQRSEYVLKKETINGNWQDLQLYDGVSGVSGIYLQTNKTYGFNFRVVARGVSQLDNAAYEIEGVLNNTSGTSTILTSSKNIIMEESGATNWDIEVRTTGIDDAKYLQVMVKGETAININWSAYASIVEVGG
jgi:hypothetical protein